MAFRPSDKKKRAAENLDLDITPIMNLMVVLIPLLLSTAKFTQIALLEYLPPAEAAPTENAAPSEGDGGGEEQASLNLLVNLSETGSQISLYQTVEDGPNFYEIPKLANGDYNWVALKDSLWSIKQREVGEPIGTEIVQDERTGEMTEKPKYRVKDGEEVSITAVGATPFQTIVRLMDHCRYYEVDGSKRTLFPITLLKQFQ